MVGRIIQCEMSLASGTRLGPYEIVSLLGAGGMGEVYVARDTRLERTVAVKVLLSGFADDPGRRARFEREARTIASLAHPHICTIHDVGDHGGTPFLVMERLEGETLASRLTRGRLPVHEAIACAIQIASGLECAHRAGIVHRDLKPANVMLTKTGAILLDFGLAKPVSEQIPAGDDATGTAPLTMQGEILGTLPYMAPEQLEGKTVDERTDIFAFGTIVHEMVTGQRPFSGASQASLIGAILHSNPPSIAALVPGTPRALARLIAVCLAKDPRDRWSSAHDLQLQLEDLDEDDVPNAVAAPGANRFRERLAWTVAAAALLAALALGVLFVTDRPQPAQATVNLVSVVPLQDTSFVRGEAPQISPDGRRVAFAARDGQGTRGIYLRDLDSATARLLPGTENGAQPFWSPDSQRLGFFAEGQLKTVAITGGSPNAIARATLARGAAWSRDNVILFSPRPNVPLAFLPAGGGELKSVPGPAQLGIPGFPAFLPDGRHYLFTELDQETRRARFLSLGSLDSPDSRRLVETTSSGVYASGHLLFRRNTTLLAQPFDPITLQVSGTAVAIAENVGFNPVTYQALFSASASGTVAYRDALPGAELVWFDRSGRRLSNAAAAGEYNSMCMPPNGSRIVYELADPATGSIDLWTLDLTTSATTQLTFAGPVEFYPVCAPDGRDMVFAALKPNVPNLFRQSILAPGQATLLLASPFAKIPTDWSRDGRWLLYTVFTANLGTDIAVIPTAGGEPRMLVSTPAEERNGKLSPDGRWLAYVSNENGRFEVYVQPMPQTGSKWLVSKGGGLQPQWSADGRELYYIATDRKLMVMAITTDGAALVPSVPTVLMNTNITEWEAGNQGVSYLVAPDGKRILISTSTDMGRPITLLQNWTAALRP